MTKRFPDLTSAALAFTLIAAPALADAPGNDWMPVDQAVRKLGEAGYSDIREIEAEDGRWEGKASKDGRVVEFTLDPKSGAIAEVPKSDRKEEESEGGKKTD